MYACMRGLFVSVQIVGKKSKNVLRSHGSIEKTTCFCSYSIQLLLLLSSPLHLLILACPFFHTNVSSSSSSSSSYMHCFLLILEIFFPSLSPKQQCYNEESRWQGKKLKKNVMMIIRFLSVGIFCIIMMMRMRNMIVDNLKKREKKSDLKGVLTH